MCEIKSSTYNVDIYRFNTPPDGNGGSRGESDMNQCIQVNKVDNATFLSKEEGNPRDVAEERILDDLPLQLNENEYLQGIVTENTSDNPPFPPKEEEHPRDLTEEKKRNSWSM